MALPHRHEPRLRNCAKLDRRCVFSPARIWKIHKVPNPIIGKKSSFSLSSNLLSKRMDTASPNGQDRILKKPSAGQMLCILKSRSLSNMLP